MLPQSILREEVLTSFRLFKCSRPRCSVKKLILKISQNSKENTDNGVSFLIKLEGGGIQVYQRKIPAQVFSLRTAFL